MRVSVYDKELAKKLIDEGECTQFYVEIDSPIRNGIEQYPKTRVQFTIILRGQEFVKLLTESLKSNE